MLPAATQSAAVPMCCQVLLQDPRRVLPHWPRRAHTRGRPPLFAPRRQTGRCPSIDVVLWENLRYPHYQAIKGKQLSPRYDPNDPNSGYTPGTINLTLTHLRGVAR